MIAVRKLGPTEQATATRPKKHTNRINRLPTERCEFAVSAVRMERCEESFALVIPMGVKEAKRKSGRDCLQFCTRLSRMPNVDRYRVK